jgi:hypothetical protein
MRYFSPLAIALLVCGCAFAAVDGTVVNATTGQPQPGASVTLFRIGQGGMSSLGTAVSDAQGKFSIAQDGEGSRLLQTAYAGVTYNQMVQPGSATNGLKLEVFNTSPRQGEVKLNQHFVIFQPSGSELKITEGYIFQNGGKLTWHDPAGGTLRFFLPAAAKEEVQVQATAPNGMPVTRPADKTAQADVYKVDFAVKPGETRFDVSYTLPFSPPATFASRVLYPGAVTSLVAPAGVEIAGEGLTLRGQEPNTQASIFDVNKSEFQVKVAGAARPAEAAESNEPGVQEILPRISDSLGYIIGLALSILVLGFILLYRANAKGASAAGAAPAKGGPARRRG